MSENILKKFEISDNIKEYIIINIFDVFLSNLLDDFQITYFSDKVEENLKKQTYIICKRIKRGCHKDELIEEFKLDFKENILDEDQD